MRKTRGGPWLKGVVSVFDPEHDTYEVQWENGDQESLLPGQLASILTHTRTGGRPDEQGHGAGAGSASDTESGSSAESADDAALVVDAEEAEEAEEADGDAGGMAADLAAPSALELLPAIADLEYETIAPLHQALVEALARDALSFRMPLHRDYMLSGITLDYAVPKYRLPTHSRALLDWLDQQRDDEEFQGQLKPTDLNCVLDFADWVQRNQTSHREYRALVELITKWMPEECMPDGKAHPDAYLLRLLKTRKGLEETVDRRIAKRKQASLCTAGMLVS